MSLTNYWIFYRAAYFENEKDQEGEGEGEGEKGEDREEEKGGGTLSEQKQKHSHTAAAERGGGRGAGSQGGNRLYDNFTKPFRDSLRSPLQPLMEVTWHDLPYHNIT